VAEPETVPLPRSARLTLLVAGQLLLAWGVVVGFRLESSSFRVGLAVLFLAYPLHVILPPRARLPFFGILSLASIVFVAGWLNAAWIVALGGGLIALCHLPVPFRVRLALIGLATLLLALFRATPPSVLPRPWSDLVWPILASMFMFRLMIYLHALRKKDVAFSPATSLWTMPLRGDRLAASAAIVGCRLSSERTTDSTAGRGHVSESVSAPCCSLTRFLVSRCQSRAEQR